MAHRDTVWLWTAEPETPSCAAQPRAWSWVRRWSSRPNRPRASIIVSGPAQTSTVLGSFSTGCWPDAPFASDTPVLLLASHIKETPPPLRQLEPSVPLQVAALVERCLEKEPGDRPASASAVVATFADVLRQKG